MKKISIISPTYNEEVIIKNHYESVKKIIDEIKNYEFEIIYIDNSSTDSTSNIIKNIIKGDKRVRLIVNTRNFGHVRSPYWGIMQTNGDATIYLASDLQDPPNLIKDFIKFWEKGWMIVLGVKNESESKGLLNLFRIVYYKILNFFSNVPVIENSTGFGLYDKKIINHIKKINDPYPFLRGLICELGYPIKSINFKQPKRKGGFSKNNLYTLYDFAMLGIISNSNIPLRMISFFGYFIAVISLLLAVFYFVLKFNNWYIFPAGIAPMIISVFIFFGLLFIFLGIIGEYLSVIYTHLKNRPIVVEFERINFDLE